jgi:hypothetical protein
LLDVVQRPNDHVDICVGEEEVRTGWGAVDLALQLSGDHSGTLVTGENPGVHMADLLLPGLSGTTQQVLRDSRQSRRERPAEWWVNPTSDTDTTAAIDSGA